MLQPARRLRGHGPSWTQEHLDGVPLIHRAVPLGGAVERELEVEDLAGVDLTLPDAFDEVGQESAHGRRTAVEVDLREEDLITGQLDIMGDAHVSDVPTRSRGPDGLHHRLLGPDG